MKDQILEILEEIRPDVDSLVGALNDEFDIDIQVGNLVPDNFNSIEGMIALVEKLQDED